MTDVPLDGFWQLMCDERFVRLSETTGRIGAESYRTAYAPERVDGFIERVIGDVKRGLGAYEVLA